MMPLICKNVPIQPDTDGARAARHTPAFWIGRCGGTAERARTASLAVLLFSFRSLEKR
jgi:hypothetical protein